MAYNFENVTPYVSTSNQTAANNQMLVSGFQNSMKTFQALEQQRLKENSRKNALIDKDIKDAEAAWNLSVGEARKTGKVVDLDSKLKDLKTEYYRLNQSRKNEGANIGEIDYKLSQILTMPDNLKNMVENLGVDGTEWSTKKPGQTNPAQDPNLSMFLNTVTQAKTFEAPVYDENNNVIKSGFKQEYSFDLDTYSWNLSTSRVDPGSKIPFYSINSNSYDAMDMGLYNPVDKPLNSYVSIGEKSGLYGTKLVDKEYVPDTSVLNPDFIKPLAKIQIFDKDKNGDPIAAIPGKEIYQMQKVVDIEKIKASLDIPLQTAASAYLVSPVVAATAWNKDFMKPKEVGADGIEFIPEGEDERLYEMWDANTPLTTDQRNLLSQRYKDKFYEDLTASGVLNPSPDGVPFGPGKSNAQGSSVNDKIKGFIAGVESIASNNINGAAAFWKLNDEKTAYKLQAYRKNPFEEGSYVWVDVGGVPSVSLGDTTAFAAAINN